MRDVESTNEAMLKAQGANMYAARQRSGLTLQDVADATGGAISIALLSRWENGAAEPKAKQVVALSQTYGVSTEELLMGAPMSYDGSMFYSSAREVADALGGAGVNAVREAISSGEIPSHVIFGKRRVYKRELLDWALSR